MSLSDELASWGEFKEDKRDGKGIYILIDGRQRKGLWKRGKPWNVKEYDVNGKITISWKNGKVE